MRTFNFSKLACRLAVVVSSSTVVGCAAMPETEDVVPTWTAHLPPTGAQSQPISQEPKKVPPEPAYAKIETLPIDLPTVLRIVDENSPMIRLASARIDEANARLAKAELQWLPNLTAGTAYQRFDGQTQNQAGFVFGVSRANLFASGGPALSLDVSEALYGPLVARRVRSASVFQHVATALSQEQEAALAYLDLVQWHAQLAINEETLARAEELLKSAENAKEAKLDRTAGDVNRAKTEVLFRRTERYDLMTKAASASARLSQLLNLQPNIKLLPADTTVAPWTLVESDQSIDQLLDRALTSRPDLAAGREIIAAAWAKVRQAEREPFLPKVVVQNQTGTFGGGFNDDLSNFDVRNALGIQLFWEVRNLGFGNAANVAERRAIANQAHFQLAETQARAAAEIVNAAQTAAFKRDAIGPAEDAVKEATELYRINKSGTQNLVDTKNLFDAIRPLQAIQSLNTARQNYLLAIMDYNRAQIRLLAAVGISPAAKQP